MRSARLYPTRVLHGQVAHEIGRHIVAGAIPEESLLPREAQLAQKFGVSRQAVREALKVLAAKGLVVSRRRTGTQVQLRSEWNLLDPDVLAWHPPERLPPDFVRDLFELRLVVEPAAAEWAAVRGTEAAIASIHIALEAMRAGVDDHEAFVAADVAFHTSIANASGNGLFFRLSAIYAPMLRASFALQVRITPRARVEANTLPTHTALYEAIADHDAPSARFAAEALLTGAQREVSSIVRKAGGPPYGEL